MKFVARRPVTVALVTVLVVVVGLVTARWLTRQGREDSDAAVRVDEVSVPPPLAAPTGARQRQIAALERLTEVLQEGAGRDDFVLNNLELDFGPNASMTAPGR